MEAFIKLTVIAAFTILAPIHSVMYTVGFLIMTDLITGVWAAKHRKEKISSAGIRRTISKMLIFQLAVISGFLIETYISPGIPLAKVVASAIALSELISVFENMQTITGKNVFAELIKKIGSTNDQTKN